LVAYNGVTEAQHNVAVCYEYGIGVPQNYRIAAQWYRLAYKQGSKEAMCNLGMLYARGRGVEKDENKGFQLIMESANRGYPWAMTILGHIYKNGLGLVCQRDLAKAIEWFQRAKENGEDVEDEISNLKSDCQKNTI
jgi:TPR repeat protein